MTLVPVRINKGRPPKPAQETGPNAAEPSRQLLLRKPGWIASYVQYLEAAKKKTFDWDPKSGSDSYNCLTFMLGGIKAQTDFDIYEYMIGDAEYTTQLQAYKVISDKFGASGLQDLLDKYFTEKPEVKVQVGDLALVQTEAGPACALTYPPHIYAMLWDTGTTDVSFSARIKFYDPMSFNAMPFLTKKED